jgi:hypothetical protein
MVLKKAISIGREKHQETCDLMRIIENVQHPRLADRPHLISCSLISLAA